MCKGVCACVLGVTFICMNFYRYVCARGCVHVCVCVCVCVCV